MANIPINRTYFKVEPRMSNEHVKSFLVKKGINPTQAAKALNVSSSTVKRYLDGGSLTVSMATKLHRVYGIDPEILFNIDAKCLAYKVRNL